MREWRKYSKMEQKRAARIRAITKLSQVFRADRSLQCRRRTDMNNLPRSIYRLNSVRIPGRFLLSDTFFPCRRIKIELVLARPPPIESIFQLTKIDLYEVSNMQENGKYFIVLKGEKYEVSQDIHEAFYQEERREKYIAEKDHTHNVVVLNIAGMEELEVECSQELLASPEPSFDDQLIAKEMKDHLHQCLQMLPRAERELINAIYFDGETETAYARRTGYSQPTVNYRRKKILAKLRILMNKLGSFSDFSIILF